MGGRGRGEGEGGGTHRASAINFVVTSLNSGSIWKEEGEGGREKVGVMIISPCYRLKEPEFQCFRGRIGVAKTWEDFSKVSSELKALLLVRCFHTIQHQYRCFPCSVIMLIITRWCFETG